MFRFAAAALILLLSPAAAMAQTAPAKSAYNAAIEKAQLYDKLGDSMLTGMSAMVDTGSTAAEVCPYLTSAIDDWKKAATFYDAAQAAAADPTDTDRRDAAALKDAGAFSLQKAERGQGIFDKSCKG
ncbi:MAG: hypothetical protein JF615_04795 [Asticcacaulis sp.]|nr:hypothetical protein [Asticcacaulis sp.]